MDRESWARGTACVRVVFMVLVLVVLVVLVLVLVVLGCVVFMALLVSSCVSP